MFFKDHDHIDMLMLKELKSVLNKATNETEELARNMLKHLLGSNSLYQPFFAAYDFEIMIIKTDGYLKLEELRKNRDESYTTKTGEHIPTGSVMPIYYLEDFECKKMNIFDTEEKIVWMYLSKGE